MVHHYFKIAIRNLSRQKALAFINVMGLSIGLACFILFLLYALNEFTFDRFNINSENIFRMYHWNGITPGQLAGGSPYMPIPLGPAMKEDFPDVVNYVRFKEGGVDDFVRVNNTVFTVPLTLADPSVFSIFSFQAKEGNLSSALSDPHQVVLTTATAKRLFGKEDPMGKTVEIKFGASFEPFIVSAVSEDPPSNSTITFQILISFQNYLNTDYGKKEANAWDHYGYPTYVQLKPGSHLGTDQKQLDRLFADKYPDYIASLQDSSWKKTGLNITFKMMPLTIVHTNTAVSGSITGTTDPKKTWILLMIAASILVIACINFTTLAIGRSAGRAREIGIRKVIGSSRKQLIAQFMMEAILLSLVSAGIGFFIAKLFLPSFNELAGTQLDFSFRQFPEMIWMLLGLIILVGILSGIYPALILSGFKPVTVLKQKLRLGGSSVFMKSLVTFQFILSAALIISTIIILQQLNYMRTANPGFNKENVVVVDAEGTDSKKGYPLFQQSLVTRPEIIGVAGSEIGLGGKGGWDITSWDDDQQNHHDVYEYYVDPHYLDVLGLHLLAGRNFNPAITSDTVTSVIINEEMMKSFGWTLQNAVGQQLKGYSEDFMPVVIGVVNDFHFKSFSEEIKPEMFQEFQGYEPYQYFVRIQPGDPSKALADIKNAWATAVPDLPFRYSFLDEDLNLFYQSEERWSSIVGLAASLCIFLACLGLLGLASLAAVNRTKEIGIRKVLGASVGELIALLSGDFLRLVFIALIVASPLAWYFMNKWLQGYAYRINISWIVFAVTGITALAIAFLTVGLQAARAAIANPVKSLRSE